MTDSILVSVAKLIADQLETRRKAGGFELSDFVVDWDFQARQQDSDLKDDDTHVCVIVPRAWDQVERFDRGALTWVAAWDITVRRRMNTTHQTSSQTIERDDLSQLTRLVEQIHQFFHATLSGCTIDVTDHGLNAEWIDQRDGVGKSSEILIAYSPKYLRESRQFFGVCREVFQVT